MSFVQIMSVDCLAIPRHEHQAFVAYLQLLMNRRQLGYLRYEQKSGGPDKRKKYLTRMKKELAAYVKTGNAEHLYNIATYIYLETRAPENKRFHHDSTVGSVTRKKMGGDES